MTLSFETEVLPVVTKHARQRFGRNDELVSRAEVLAWWIWHNRKQDFPPSAYAAMAVRNAREGRDLPGVQETKRWGGDPLDRAWQGAGMGEVVDRRPGPDKEAEWKEDLENWLRSLTDRQREMAELVMDGVTKTEDLARAMHCTAGAVSQMRRRLAEKE